MGPGGFGFSAGFQVEAGGFGAGVVGFGGIAEEAEVPPGGVVGTFGQEIFAISSGVVLVWGLDGGVVGTDGIRWAPITGPLPGGLGAGLVGLGGIAGADLPGAACACCTI